MQNVLPFNLSYPLNFNQVHLNFQVKQDFDGNCVPVDFRMGFLNEGMRVHKSLEVSMLSHGHSVNSMIWGQPYDFGNLRI